MEQRIEIDRLEEAANIFGSFDENIRLIPGRRADLEQSAYMKELRRIIDENTKGGSRVW